jgi:hypothetical protein
MSHPIVQPVAEFLVHAALLVFAAVGTGLLPDGVVRLALATDRPRRSERGGAG